MLLWCVSTKFRRTPAPSKTVPAYFKLIHLVQESSLPIDLFARTRLMS